MKRITSALTAFFMILLPLGACGGGNRSNPLPAVSEISSLSDALENVQNPEEIVDNILTQNHFRGIAYLVKNGEILYNKGFGNANTESDLPNTSDTVFRIASNTKQFTAAAILLLHEAGKLSVQDSLESYFPDYPYAKDITIHELLCMRSGIKDYIAYTDPNGNHIALRESEIEYDISPTAAPEENISSVKAWLFGQELNFAPNAQFEYSNSNYLLLADIIQQTSGLRYEDYLHQAIFEPLGMTATGFCDSYDVTGAVVARPQKSDDSTAYMTWSGMSFGAGDILSNAEDIAKWLDSFASNKLLSENSLKAMTANYSGADDTMPYGYGLMIADNGGIYHSGYLPSFSSAFYTLPARQYSLILMSNSPSGNIEVIMNRINRELSDMLQ